MKCDGSDDREANIHEAQVTIPEAYRLVWDAGSLVLRSTSNEAMGPILADEISKLFGKLDDIQAESDVIAPGLPNGEVPRITVGVLTKDLEKERQEILDHHALISDRPVNPLMIHDDRFHAISALAFSIEVAYNSANE